ncbi:MAG TPA: hypothetical protein EYP25_07545 [Anaerolineae bacterium]|nr:sulfotransferase family protein [Caldilineae bacterium]HID34409.1 hypothetical protein [Anaerolineae bacterium]HIQ12246.1 hypothetical protein [Caldilineales bacterium]
MIPWLRKRKTSSPSLGPVVIYHHIAKTGGTSLRKVVQANYKGKALWESYGPNRGSVAWYEAHYHALSPERKAAIQCIAGHSAHYIIPAIDRPFRVFTLLRDPVERMISLYYFAQTLARRGQGKGAEIGRALQARGWTLADIYTQLGGGQRLAPEERRLFAPFFNGQTRAILGPHTDTSAMPFLPGDSEALEPMLRQTRQVLDAYYELGVTEAYAESVQHFARVFGWRRVFLSHVNRTRKRPRVHELPPRILAMIREYNALDHALHAYAAQRLAQHQADELREVDG